MLLIKLILIVKVKINWLFFCDKYCLNFIYIIKCIIFYFYKLRFERCSNLVKVVKFVSGKVVFKFR